MQAGQLADADMEAAIKRAMTGIFYNKGEVCAAGSRLFLEGLKLPRP